MLVMDGNGRVGLQYSGGGGGYAGAGGGISLQVQYTNANSIRELGGLSTQTGGSADSGPIPLCAGPEFITGETYQGFNGMVGVGKDTGFKLKCTALIECGVSRCEDKLI